MQIIAFLEQLLHFLAENMEIICLIELNKQYYVLCQLYLCHTI